MQNRDKAIKLKLIYEQFQKQMSSAEIGYKTVEVNGSFAWFYKLQVINSITISLYGLNKKEKKDLWKGLSEINEAVHPMTSTGYNIHIEAINQNDRYFLKELSEELELIKREYKQRHNSREQLAFKILSLSLAIQREATLPLWLLLPLDIKKYILNMMIDPPEKSIIGLPNKNLPKQNPLLGLSKQHITSCVSLLFSNNEMIRKTVKKAHDEQKMLVVTTSQTGKAGELTLRNLRPK